MGTRHLIAVVLDGEFKIAQYGQWDGYPGGQGVDVLNFLRTTDLDKFAEEVRKLRFANDEDNAKIRAAWAAVGAKDDGWVTMEQSDAFHEANPQFNVLSRDTGAQVLPLVAGGGVEFLHDQSDFALDSLFCEWAYVVDLDRGVLEAYKGFQKDLPKAGRWAGQRRDGEEYAAVELAGEWKISDLPTDDEFCAALDPVEDEEE